MNKTTNDYKYYPHIKFWQVAFGRSAFFVLIAISKTSSPFHGDCTDATHEASLAAALRHSQQQAQRTYDRRTANDRKQLAVNLAREYAEEHLEEEPDNGQPQSFKDCPFKPGDFVAVVEEHSKLNRPKVLIGSEQWTESLRA